MKRKIPFISLALALIWLGFLSCDRRGSTISGGGENYTLDLIPLDTVTIPDQEVPVACFVRDYTGLQVGNITVNFEVFDFGYISSEKMSSETDTVDGLQGDLYFDPKGNYGDAELVACIYDEVNEQILLASDTAIVEVLPYTLDSWSEFSTINLTDTTHICCRVINPITLVQTGDIHLQFTAIDFGYVTPTAMSDALSPSGLQSNVIFIANDNTTGIARVVANAVFPYPTNVMGTDTVEILVASQ